MKFDYRLNFARLIQTTCRFSAYYRYYWQKKVSRKLSLLLNNTRFVFDNDMLTFSSRYDVFTADNRGAIL